MTRLSLVPAPLPRRKGGTVDDDVTRYLAHLRLQGLSPGTIYARKRLLIRLQLALPVPLNRATPQMLENWRASLEHTPAVIAGYVSHARCYYSWAVTQGLCPANPAAAVPVPRKPRRLPRPITEADLMAAIVAAPARIRAWLILAGWCGLRAKEIALLRAENLALRASPPAVHITWDATKGNGERLVVLCPWAAAELAAAGLPSSGWAFRRADGRPGPNKPHRVSQAANEFLHEHGIAATLHQLRHRFGTQLLRTSGGNLREVQEALGHQSITSTTIYTLVETSSLAAAVAALPVPELAAAG
jgi:site-specific recombinase XerC